VTLRAGERGAPSPPMPALAAIALATLAAARLYPFETHPLFACPLRTLTGVACPTCGMTRAFVRTVHGNLAGAAAASPLGTMLALGAAVLVAWTLLRLTVVRRGLHVEFTRQEASVLRAAAVLAIAANWAWVATVGAH